MDRIIARVLKKGPLTPKAFVNQVAKLLKRDPDLRNLNSDPIAAANMIRQQGLANNQIVEVVIRGNELIALPREGVPA